MSNRYKYIDENKEHLHTLDGRPLIGTSTVVSETLAKNLTWWAAELAAVECLEAGEKIPTIREEYLAAAASPDKKKMIDALQKKYPIFKTARFAHYNTKNEKAKSGTDMHAELELYVKHCISENNGEPTVVYLTSHEAVKTFRAWALANVKQFLWSEGHCYSEKLWCGGISDCGAILNDGSYAIIDFKSSKEAYASQFFQIAGYDLQVMENGLMDKDGNVVYRIPEGKEITKHIVFPFGAEKPEAQVSLNYITNQEAFKHTVGLYKIMQQLGAI